MSLTVKTLNNMLDSVFSQDLFVAALTDADASAEVLTGRKPISFTAANIGAVLGNSDEDLVIQAGTTVTHLAIFDSLTSGDLICILELTDPESYSNEGSMSVRDLSISLV